MKSGQFLETDITETVFQTKKKTETKKNYNLQLSDLPFRIFVLIFCESDNREITVTFLRQTADSNEEFPKQKMRR